MRWLRKLFRDHDDRILRNVDRIAEQGLDSLGWYCQSVRSFKVVRGGRYGVLVVIHSDCIGPKQLDLFRTWLTVALNERHGLKLSESEVMLVCSRSDAETTTHPGSSPQTLAA